MARAEADAEKARLRAEALKTESNGETDGEAKFNRESHEVASPLMEPSPLEQNLKVMELEAPAERIQPNGQLNTGEVAPDNVALNGEATISKGDLISDSLDKLTAGLTGNRSQEMASLKHDPSLDEALRLNVADNENLSTDLSSEDSLSTSSSSLDRSDLSDETSSSGLNLPSEDSEDESGPEEASSRRKGPERVAAPPRQETRSTKNMCRQFAKTGHCRRGNRCKFLHELSERNGHAKPRDRMQAPERERERRPGLLQAVCATFTDPIS